MYGALFFLTGPQRMETSAAELVVGAGAFAGLFWFVFFGWLSDRVGRKKPIVAGHISPLLLRSEEHTSELQSLMHISYAVFCLHQQKISISGRDQGLSGQLKQPSLYARTDCANHIP